MPKENDADSGARFYTEQERFERYVKSSDLLKKVLALEEDIKVLKSSFAFMTKTDEMRHDWIRTEGKPNYWHCTKCTAWTKVILPGNEQEKNLPDGRCPHIDTEYRPKPCPACGQYRNDWYDE